MPETLQAQPAYPRARIADVPGFVELGALVGASRRWTTTRRNPVTRPARTSARAPHQRRARTVLMPVTRRGVSASVVQAISALVDGGAREGRVSRGTRTLRWIETGSGEPVVVAGAGAGEPGSLAWAGVLPALPATIRVVAYDRAGLGLSDPVSELSLEQELDDLMAVVAAAGDLPCVLVGHSWGGLLALLAALLHPDAVSGLVLIDPADERFWKSLPPDAHRREEDRIRALIGQLESDKLAATIRELCLPFARTVTDEPAIQQLLLDAYVSCYGLVWQRSTGLDEFRLAMASIPQISAIRATHPPPDVPMIVFSATTGLPAAQRRAWTEAHADLAAGARRSTHTILPETGHAIQEERPREVAAAIARIVRMARAEQPDAPSRPSGSRSSR